MYKIYVCTVYRALAPESINCKVRYFVYTIRRTFSLMKSYMAKPGSIEHKWFVVDAEGKVFGRVASQVASVLRGKA